MSIVAGSAEFLLGIHMKGDLPTGQGSPGFFPYDIGKKPYKEKDNDKLLSVRCYILAKSLYIHSMIMLYPSM